ncbi:MULTISPECIES: hypothetical protein [unclassified Delftia]|uniref:hypothetical protein n=1 Tax=unclassified Delftia TaxID=2613839 RepID=UPI0018FFF2A8|nr:MULTISPECIES: hypothetical protein [unclassified Delftia]MBK0115694.1 hypothetical protein [Delftia sp. S65]MBK0121326.1 hypothetical protein [Delftia sp. S67]MBK0133391.1 hypothetical protein [Delftia sp. S66]
MSLDVFLIIQWGVAILSVVSTIFSIYYFKFRNNKNIAHYIPATDLELNVYKNRVNFNTSVYNKLEYQKALNKGDADANPIHYGSDMQIEKLENLELKSIQFTNEDVSRILGKKQGATYGADR